MQLDVLTQFAAAVLVAGVAVCWRVVTTARTNRHAHAAMLASLDRGAEVVTSGGTYGKITALDGQVVTLEVAAGVIDDFGRSVVL